MTTVLSHLASFSGWGFQAFDFNDGGRLTQLMKITTLYS